MVDDRLHAVDDVQRGGAAGFVAPMAVDVGERGGEHVDDGQEIAQRDKGVGRLWQDDLERGDGLEDLLAQRLKLGRRRRELREQALRGWHADDRDVGGRACRAQAQLGEPLLHRGDARPEVVDSARGRRRRGHSAVTRSTSSSVVTPSATFCSADSRSVLMP